MGHRQLNALSESRYPSGIRYRISLISIVCVCNTVDFWVSSINVPFVWRCFWVDENLMEIGIIHVMNFERSRSVNITWNFSSMRMCVIPVLAFWVSNIKVRFCITMVLVVLEGNK